jgi:hypothetical protein
MQTRSLATHDLYDKALSKPAQGYATCLAAAKKQQTAMMQHTMTKHSAMPTRPRNDAEPAWGTM